MIVKNELTCKVVADEVGKVGIVGIAPSSNGLGFDCTVAFSSLACSDRSGVFSAVRGSALPVRRGIRCK